MRRSGGGGNRGAGRLFRQLCPGVVLLTLLWAIISPVVVIGLFQSRFPLVPITTGFGARLGLLTGLAVGVVLSDRQHD